MMHLYSAFFYCCTPKVLYNHGGGLSSTTTSVQHPLGWCDGCQSTTVPVRSPHTSYRWRGERDIEPIKWMVIIMRSWLTRASGGNLARTPGLHPTLYEKCHGIFNDHRESGPRFNVSSERRYDTVFYDTFMLLLCPFLSLYSILMAWKRVTQIRKKSYTLKNKDSKREFSQWCHRTTNCKEHLYYLNNIFPT